MVFPGGAIEVEIGAASERVGAIRFAVRNAAGEVAVAQGVADLL